MTQLEEYLERRELLQQRMREYRAAAFDREAPQEERREANRKFNQYSEMLTDLDEQIRAIDPKAIPRSRRKARQGTASLNKRLDSGTELGALVSAPAQEDAAAHDETMQLWKRNAERAARYLPPRQAEALDLRYNSGYSLKKTAEVMGVSVNTVSRHIKVANKKLQDWMMLVFVAGGCTVSDEVFMFDEFLQMAPHAFPRSLREIILVLYNAPSSAYPTASALAKAQGWNYINLCRQLGWIRALCEIYGIPITACHPLIQRSNNRRNNAEAAFHQFDRFRKSAYGCYYRHDDAQKNFEARDPLIRYSTVEEAVAGVLKHTYRIEQAPSWAIAEGVGLFNDERVQLARRRLDGGETLSSVCRENTNGHAVKQIRAVIEVSALYAYFRIDLREIYREPDMWDALFERWSCFPGRQEETLRLLLERPGIRTTRALAEQLGIAESGALRLLRKIAFYAVWWEIPADALPELVRRHAEDCAAITRNANTFQRAVKLRHDPRKTESNEDDGA